MAQEIPVPQERYQEDSTEINIPNTEEDSKPATEVFLPAPCPNANNNHHESQLGGAKLPISLAFKRTCYKCGNLGHHADDCESKERLCYNCKQPGHESPQCPNDRNTQAKQCYFCKQMGHIQSECPEYRALRRDHSSYSHHHHSHHQPPPPQHLHQPNYIPCMSPVQQAPTQIIYYSQLRTPQLQNHRDLFQRPQVTPQHQQFYYASPLRPYSTPQGYPPPQSMAPAPPGPPPSMQCFQPGMMRPTEFIPQPPAQHYAAPHVVVMRGYTPPRMAVGPVLCHVCGEHGHEAQDCSMRR